MSTNEKKWRYKMPAFRYECTYNKLIAFIRDIKGGGGGMSFLWIFDEKP